MPASLHRAPAGACGRTLFVTPRQHGQRHEPRATPTSDALSHGGLTEVHAALTHLDRYRGTLPGSLGLLRFALEKHLGAHRLDPMPMPVPPPLFTFEAGRALLWAVLGSLDAGGDVALSDRVDEWAARPLAASDLAARRWPSASESTPYDSPISFCWLALDHLGADAAPLIEARIVESPFPFAKDAPHYATCIPRTMMRMYPQTRAPFVAACQRLACSDDSERAEHGQGLPEGLDSFLVAGG
ncbi:MAG: hypothetical protein EOO75_03535 [Myxococcales bacterium]|nr:MAG: hypothetical protein EOO75_03535 [Myxococcales bacterium]